MARAAAALTALALLLLGSGVVGDDPGVLVALVGAALCALGCARGARAVVATGSAVVVPGRRVRRSADGASRQHHPDAPGRPRPRAPGRALPVV